MEVSCSFKSIVGSPCSYDRRDQSKSVTEVPLLSCVKDIESHKSLWSFAGVNGEQELILLRAGIFNTQQDVSALSICPFHRSELGIGWRRSSNTCSVHVMYIQLVITSSRNTKSTKTLKTPRAIYRVYFFCLNFKEVEPGSCVAFIVNLRKEALNRLLEQQI